MRACCRDCGHFFCLTIVSLQCVSTSSLEGIIGAIGGRGCRGFRRETCYPVDGFGTHRERSAAQPRFMGRWEHAFAVAGGRHLNKRIDERPDFLQRPGEFPGPGQLPANKPLNPGPITTALATNARCFAGDGQAGSIREGGSPSPVLSQRRSAEQTRESTPIPRVLDDGVSIRRRTNRDGYMEPHPHLS